MKDPTPQLLRAVHRAVVAVALSFTVAAFAASAATDRAAASTPTAITTGSLATYSNTSDHATFTSGAPGGYRFEGTLGQAYMVGSVPGTHVLYECAAGGDHFTSGAAGCEGQRMVGRLGWIYDSPQTSKPTVPVVRCTTQTGDHFDSNDPNCEGRHVEGVIGYAIATTSLARALYGYRALDGSFHGVGG